MKINKALSKAYKQLFRIKYKPNFVFYTSIVNAHGTIYCLVEDTSDNTFYVYRRRMKKPVTSKPWNFEIELDFTYKINGTLKGSNLIFKVRNNKLHYNLGPAYQNLYEDAKNKELFFLNGKKMSKKKYWDKQKNTRYAHKIFARKFGTE